MSGRGNDVNQSQRMIIFGLQILFEWKWQAKHALVIEENAIKDIIPQEEIQHYLPAKQLEFPQDHYLIPGLIDLHIHGAGGKDVMDASQEALITMSKTLAREGVTGFLATTMTAENTHIEAALATVQDVMPHCDGAQILGVHLEGPFIAKTKMGAQIGDLVLPPDVALMAHWRQTFPNMIKLVTLAPELSGATQLIQYLRQNGIIASIGHSDATYVETQAGIAAGCTHATHLFNAMRGVHQREPGAVGALLLSDQVMAELIVDGLHLHPAIVELAFKLKGKDRLLLVTDAIRAKCFGDGCFELGGQHVDVKAGKAMLMDGTLAGSTLRMPQAIKNMMHFTGCSLADAICMASYNPAKVLGLDAQKGSIAVGKDADLVVLNPALEVVMTLCEGRETYSGSNIINFIF